MVTGKIYYGDDVSDKEEAELFKKLFTFITTNSGARHPGEYLPFMKIFGGSFEKEVKAAAKVIDEMLQRLLDECKSDKDGNTMVNHLLSLQQDDPEYYTDIIIKGLMLVTNQKHSYVFLKQRTFNRMNSNIITIQNLRLQR